MGKVKASLFKRVLSKFRYGLVLHVIRNQLAKVGIEFTPYYWIVTKPINSEIPEIDGIISEYSVEFLEEKDMKTIVENSLGYTEKGFLSNLRNGKRCLGLKHNDDIVAFIWISLNRCDFEPIDMPLEPDEAYLTAAFTMEANRGKNLAPYLRYRCCEILNKMGRNKIYSVVEYFNTSALKYIQKTNVKILKLALFIRVFKKVTRSYTIKTY